jgi:ubiquitin carboxyl-terminal hydrolase 10
LHNTASAKRAIVLSSVAVTSASSGSNSAAGRQFFGPNGSASNSNAINDGPMFDEVVGSSAVSNESVSREESAPHNTMVRRFGSSPSRAAADETEYSTSSGFSTNGGSARRFQRGRGGYGGSHSDAGGWHQAANLERAKRILSGLLSRTSLLHKGAPFQLRGLVNPGNWCYVNATLQALAACPPFFHLLRSLRNYLRQLPVSQSTAVSDAFARFMNEFQTDKSKPSAPRSRGGDISVGESFMPDYVYHMLTALKPDTTFKGKQEDAEEFLLAVLNGLHDEMVSLMSPDMAKETGGANGSNTSRQSSSSDRPVAVVSNSAGNSQKSNRDDEKWVVEDDSETLDSEWQQVGPGRRSAVTRQTTLEDSPIARIFGGVLRYSVHAPGLKESVTLQPFFTVPLDIQSPEIKDINTALSYFVRRETLKGFKKRNNVEVDATRKSSLERLPIALVFQLKYFLYGEEGLKKIHRQIQYSIDLQIDKELLSPGARSRLSNSEREYKLFSVVFHHGTKAEGGHYTANIFHGGRWVHVNDTEVTALTPDAVLRHVPNRVPYLLFYRRCDKI